MRQFETILMVLFSVMLGSAYAQVPIKCTVAGKTVYQQTPCDAGESKVVDTSGAGKADFGSLGAMQAQREIAEVQRKEAIKYNIESGRVSIGMTAKEAALSWGEPSKVNSTQTANGTSEQWIYRRGHGNDQYIYVDNGKVTAVQSPR